MTIFDQRGQHVTYQYNAYGNINFGAVENTAGLVEELKKLQAELQQAIEQKAVTGREANEAQYNLNNAVLEVEEGKPDKKTVADHLGKAKTAIEGVAAAGGLIAALAKAIELVDKLF